MEELETGGDAVLGTIKRERETIKFLPMSITSHQSLITGQKGLLHLISLAFGLFSKIHWVQKFVTTSEVSLQMTLKT